MVDSTESKAFLVIDGSPIGIADYVNYLTTSGAFESSFSAVLRAYLIDSYLDAQAKSNEVRPETVQQAIFDFRMSNQLVEAEQFDQWLKVRGLTHEVFHKRIERDFKIQKLRQSVADDRLQDYFIENKLKFDKIVLSRILTEDSEVADEIYAQIREGKPFEELARHYSIAPDKLTNGMIGVLSRADLPSELRGLVDNAQVNDLIGPLEIEGKWSIFRLDAALPASLDDEAIRALVEEEVFESWITEKIQKMNVELRLD